jgi:hypothetical protein
MENENWVKDLKTSEFWSLFWGAFNEEHSEYETWKRENNPGYKRCPDWEAAITRAKELTSKESKP